MHNLTNRNDQYPHSTLSQLFTHIIFADRIQHELFKNLLKLEIDVVPVGYGAKSMGECECL